MVRVNIVRGLRRWAGASFVAFLGLAIELPAAEPARPANNAVVPKPTDAPKRTVVRGRVLLPDGSPAAGALVTVNGQTVVRADRGGNRIVPNTQVTACDEMGEFSYAFSERIATIAVKIEAPGTVATKDYPLLPNIDNVVQLLAGTRVSGRVLHSAKGVGGIQVVLASVPSDSRGKHTAVTSDDGRFTIDHVHPERDHALFVPMDAVAADNLAAVVQFLRTGHEGQPTEVAELNLHPACTVRGKIVMSKGENPRHVSVVVARAVVGDSQTVKVDDDGAFLFRGVPREPVTLWVADAVSGSYRPSPKNYSLDPVQGSHLCGRVEEDLNLTVLLEPARVANGVPPAPQELVIQAQARAQVQGALVRMQVNGQPGALIRSYAPSDERTARRMQLQGEPLRGISESPVPAPSADKQP